MRLPVLPGSIQPPPTIAAETQHVRRRQPAALRSHETQPIKNVAITSADRQTGRLRTVLRFATGDMHALCREQSPNVMKLITASHLALRLLPIIASVYLQKPASISMYLPR